MACAVGGFVYIDFEDTKNPKIEKIDFNLSGAGYALCIVNTGGNHADLNDDYASVPAEMKAVAKELGCEYLRQTCLGEVLANVKTLREKVGDRAILRAYHFFNENDRVSAQASYLKENDVESFLEFVIKSGNSSYKYLQNVYTTKNVNEQGLSLALCLADKVLGSSRAAWRVHGGGFAGTIQAFVPADKVAEFKSTMDACFGEGACLVLLIRPVGAARII
jgi:galactokinase